MKRPGPERVEAEGTCEEPTNADCAGARDGDSRPYLNGQIRARGGAGVRQRGIFFRAAVLAVELKLYARGP